MRFIFNFIFFGILFYIIYLFFPDAFNTLVSWANQIYEFFRNLFVDVSSKVRKEESIQTTQKLLSFLKYFIDQV